MDIAKLDSASATETSTKVFISYSRKDLAFVDRLAAEIETHRVTPTLDRTEIYAFEDWWKRIDALIAAADTVIFVLSPDAVASDICRKEVERALALNKRFAPIVCRPVADRMKQIPPALADLNFIFFDRPEAFEAALAKLVEALATDIDWVRFHTEYGLDAVNWEKAGRPGGLLMRSPRLEQAERWIATRPPGAPIPAESTQALILASRRGASRRRNLLTGSLAGGLVLAVSLAGIALWQRDQVVSALKESRRELSRRLSQEVAPTLARDGSAAALGVALRSTSLDDADDIRGAVSVGGLLKSAASVRELWRASRGNAQLPWPFAFHRSDQLLTVNSSIDGSQTSWFLDNRDIRSQALVAHVALPALGESDAYVHVRVVAPWNSAIVTSLHQVVVVDLQTLRVSSRLVSDEEIRAIDFDAKAAALAVLGTRHLIVVDRRLDAERRRFDLPAAVIDNPTASFTLSADERAGYVVEPDALYRIAIEDGATKKIMLEKPEFESIESGAGVSVYGNSSYKLLVGTLSSDVIPHGNGHLDIIDVTTGVVMPVLIEQVRLGASVVSKPGRYIVLSGRSMKLFDTASDNPKEFVRELNASEVNISGIRLPPRAQIQECALNADNSAIACTYVGGDQQSLAVSTTATDDFLFGKLASFAVRNGGDMLAADEMLPSHNPRVTSDAARFLVDRHVRERLLRRPTIESLDQIELAALSKSGLSGVVIALHATSAKIATFVGDCDGNVFGLSKTGKVVWTTSETSSGDNVPSSSRVVCEWRDVGRVRRLVMSKDGIYLLVSRYKRNELEIISPDTGESLARIEGPGWPSQIAVSETDTVGVTWSKDSTVVTIPQRISFYQLPTSLVELRQLARSLQARLKANAR